MRNVAKPERFGGLNLPARNRLQPASHVLCDVGGRERRDRDHGAQYEVQFDARDLDSHNSTVRLQHQRQEEECHEEDCDEWYSSDDLDVGCAEYPNDGETAGAAEGKQDAEREGGNDANNAQDQRQQ